MGQSCSYKSAEQIDQCDFEKTPAFTLENNVYNAKVLDIYDGDTVTCAISNLNTWGQSLTRAGLSLYNLLII